MKLGLLPATLLVGGLAAAQGCATAPKTYDYDPDAAFSDGGPIDPDAAAPDGGPIAPTPKDRVACGTTFCRTDQTCQAGRCVYTCIGTQVPGDYATLGEAMAPLADKDATICYKPTTGTAGTVSIATSKSVTIIGVSPDQTPVPQITIGSGASGAGTVTLQGLVATTVSLSGTTKVNINGGKIGYVYVTATQSGEVRIEGADLGGASSSYGLYVTPGASTNPKVLAQNNYFHDAQSAAVQVYSTSGYAADVQLLNNTFRNNKAGILLTSSTGTIKLTVIGNIFANTQGIAMSLPAFAATSEFSNNLLFGNTTNYAGLAADGANYLKVDPMLDTAVPPDTRAGSPARGAGLANRSPGVDFYGISRAGKPDLGAVQSP